VFLARYRAKLYEMAGAIAQEDSAARELADSLYAELYGIGSGERRRPKLEYYLGRGSLEGWLRALLAQDYVDRYRSRKRLVSLEEQAAEGAQFAAPADDPQPVLDGRLEQATDEALAALPAADRMLLAAYFLDGRTLAEIARMLAVHESTVSRKLDKLTRNLRQAIMQGLIGRGMSPRQGEEALEADVRDLRVDVRARLAQGSAGAAFHTKDEKT
jgi:RNA polymerase sigma-70 factor (ECF subfamily)